MNKLQQSNKLYLILALVTTYFAVTGLGFVLGSDSDGSSLSSLLGIVGVSSIPLSFYMWWVYSMKPTTPLKLLSIAMSVSAAMTALYIFVSGL